MGSIVLSLSCLLLAQAADDPPLSHLSVQAEEAGGPQAAGVPPAGRRISPADIVAELLALPEDGALTGRPITLLEALSSAQDQQRQLAVTHAYWRLAQAVADYRIALEQHEQLRQIQPRPEDAMMLRAAEASAKAALRTAELAALTAQYHLADAAKLSATGPLPLSADRPHVGPYRTYFDEVFSMRNPPAHARLLHRNLPIRRQVIDARTKAVQAAHDAVVAALDAYGLGKADLADVLSSVRDWTGQHRALLASVGDYNHDIADYALSVAGPQTDQRVLVAMLIHPKPQAAPATAPKDDSGKARAPSDTQPSSTAASEVRPATLNAPLPASGSKQPTLAPLPDRLQPLDHETPELAPPPEPSDVGGDTSPSSAASDYPPTESLPDEAGRAAPIDESQTAEPAAPEPPMVPVPAGLPALTPRTTNKPSLDDSGALPPPAGLYPALIDASPDARTKHLTAALCWNRTLPDQIGQPVELRQCLSGPVVADRGQLIAAYWLAAQSAAQYQALVAEVDFLEELVPIAMERRHEPGGADDMLRLRAAKLAAQADVLAAQLDLLEAQFQLTLQAGGPLHASWLLPATTPHSEPYRLNLEGHAGESAGSWTLRRLAALIPALADSLQDRAAAVVQADAARSAATAAYQAGSQSIDYVMASVRQQTEETSAFLDTLTQYNQAIAEYTLTVLPPGTPGLQLADALLPAP
jgi:hypothetical protein